MRASAAGFGLPAIQDSLLCVLCVRCATYGVDNNRCTIDVHVGLVFVMARRS